MTKFTAKSYKVNPKRGIKTCNICLEEITKNIKTTSCKHYFHPKCLRKWIKKSPTCPTCRTHVHIPRLSTEEPIPIPQQRNLSLSDEIIIADLMSFVDELSRQLIDRPMNAEIIAFIQDRDPHAPSSTSDNNTSSTPDDSTHHL